MYVPPKYTTFYQRMEPQLYFFASIAAVLAIWVFHFALCCPTSCLQGSDPSSFCSSRGNQWISKGSARERPYSSWSKAAEVDPSSFQGTLLPSPPLWDEAPQRQHSAPHCTKSFGKQEQAVAGGKATVHPALNTTSAILPRKPQLSGITVHDEASYMVIPQHATADPLHSWGSPGLLWIKCRHIIIFLSN